MFTLRIAKILTGFYASLVAEEKHLYLSVDCLKLLGDLPGGICPGEYAPGDMSTHPYFLMKGNY